MIAGRSDSAMKRFMMGVIDDPETSEFIHRNIGGEKNGEQLEEADKELTASVRSVIEKFASAKIPEGGSLDDLKRAFGNDIRRIKAERRDEGKDDGSLLIDNYYEVALQAREHAEHGVAMEAVMEGFKVYNADVRNNQRTEAHRDNIDKIINKFEESKFGRFVPPEVVAGVVGTAFALTQTGVRAAAGALGGIAASGVFAALRERNRVTEDRARILRDAAVGLEYSGTSGEEVEGRRIDKKRAKYEARIGGTLYDIQPANKLVDDINEATESGDSEKILRALAEARVRVAYSDNEQKDLIAYSSADKMGDERLKLDMAIVMARRNLSKEERGKLGDMMAIVYKEIEDNVDENDENFKRIRAREALKKAGKTVAIGATAFFASQEIQAAISTEKAGLVEKIWGGNDVKGAQETVLANAWRNTFGGGPKVLEVTGISGADEGTIRDLQEQGYTRTEVSPAHTETKTAVTNVAPKDASNALKVERGWLNNGTKVSDGNELRLYLQDGQYVAGMSGTSTLGDEVFNYDELAAGGQIKGLINIGGGDFFVESTVNDAGNIVWPIDSAGNITTTTGEVIKAFGDNGEKLFDTFSVVADMGKNADGVNEVLSFATDVGRNSFEGTIKQITKTAVEVPAVYDFTKTITSEVYAGGIATAAGTAAAVAASNRVGLGETNRATSEPEIEEELPPTPAPEAVNEASPTTQETQNEPEPAPEPAPEPESEPSPEAQIGARVESVLANLIDDEGAKLIITPGPLTPELTERFDAYWDSLNDEQKNIIRNVQRDIMSRPELSSYGTAFREWFSENS
ncbi:hypothetical protein IJJ49_01570 [Candidatus Saccharibacteria bacterium]|nr:hypothetical protein [Candidatus Saccharibacteria bacterium]